MRRQRGLSLVEILVALALAGIVSAFLLMITRSQLMAYQMNDQVSKAQLNERAGLDYVETLLRRACGGIGNGQVYVNVKNATAQMTRCLRIYDGVEQGDFSGGSFSTTSAAPASRSDAVEVIFGQQPVTTTIDNTTSVNAPAQANVCDKTGFSVGDLVLVTNMNQAVLLAIQSITAPSGGVSIPATCTNAATFNFDGTATGITNTTATFNPAFDWTANPGTYVMKAQSLSVYRDSSTTPALLKVSPMGIAGANHTSDEPAVEGVENFELALGSDGNNGGTVDGIITESTSSPSTDEWLGNATGEIPTATTAFNVDTSGTWPQYRQVRATMTVRTLATYQGTAVEGTTSPTEDRTLSLTISASGSTTGGAPRYRVLRVTIAPRVWNLTN
jgi:prepilin-type N-terminal cleavage/methylation domain-containing protein